MQWIRSRIHANGTTVDAARLHADQGEERVVLNLLETVHSNT
jgi:hypothetical protein